jgi:MFS transporter, ACS family, tartrate transporter
VASLDFDCHLLLGSRWCKRECGLLANIDQGHLAIAAIVAVGGRALAASSDSAVVSLFGLCLAQTGMMSMLPVVWTLPTAFLTGAAAAGGIALINSVASIGGFFGAMILGSFGMWSMVACLFTGVILAMATGGRGDDKEQKR